MNPVESSRAGDDALMSLSFALHTNPGAYALLIGAGVSYSSEIPTAWGVLEDLCSQVALLQGAELSEGEQAWQWYERTHGEQPTYGRLLGTLATTPTLRQRLLEGYFEVTDGDIEAGRKVPTSAHHSIARLVANGTIRVVVTLNFDRLIEQALRSRGIEPTVVVHPDEVAGLAPLHTLSCLVVHLHGDFKNPDSMLNTDAELSEYRPETKALLERILDDHGLVIAGWSAEHDTALRNEVARRYPQARYPLAWLDPFPLGEEASALLALKQGAWLQMSADEGLTRLAEAVEALRTRNAAHPMTVPVAVATAKRELSGRQVAVDVHDQLARAFTALHKSPDFRYRDDEQAGEMGGYDAVVARIEESVRLPAAISATLAYWGADTTDSWWMPELARFAPPMPGGGVTRLLEARQIAGLWLFYAAGVAAAAASRWDVLYRMFTVTVENPYKQFDSVALDAFYEPTNIYAGGLNLYTKLAPLLMESLALGRSALDDAWQTFESLRLACVLSARPGFDEASTDYLNTVVEAMAAERAWEATNEGNTDPSHSQMERRTKWQEQKRALSKLRDLSRYSRVHVLTSDRMSENGGFTALHTARMADDVEIEKNNHFIIECGLFDDWQQASSALTAVSQGLGLVGRDVAFSANRNGAISMAVWPDTALTVEEQDSAQG